MSWPQDSDSNEPIRPEIHFQTCPIRASLGVLGRKWALLVLRDVAFFGDRRFSQIQHSNPGMTPRILSMRLQDLQDEGLIKRLVNPENPRDIRYRLTAKGQDTIPILTALIHYGIRHDPDRVFEDDKPREIGDVFPGRQKTMLGPLREYAREENRTE